MTPFERQEIEKWIDRQQTATDEAEAAMRKARFAGQMIDRLLTETGVVVEPPKPHLYLVHLPTNSV